MPSRLRAWTLVRSSKAPDPRFGIGLGFSQTTQTLDTAAMPASGVGISIASSFDGPRLERGRTWSTYSTSASAGAVVCPQAGGVGLRPRSDPALSRSSMQASGRESGCKPALLLCWARRLPGSCLVPPIGAGVKQPDELTV